MTEPMVTLIYVFAGIVGLIVITVVVLYAVRGAMHRAQMIRGGKYANVTLMVTVPKFKNESEAKSDDNKQEIQEDISIAETFFSAFGGLKAQKGLKSWFFGRSDTMALEIVAYNKLITFYITLPQYMQQFVEQQLNAQYSDAMIEVVQDFNIFSPSGTVVGGYLKFKRESLLPIKTYKDLETDPLNAITNALSKVPEGDGVAVQYVLRSARSSWRSLGKKVVKNMQKGMTFEEAKTGKTKWNGWISAFKSKEDVEADKAKEQRQLSPAEQKMVEGIQEKASKAGMDVNVRVVASATSAEAATSYLNHVLQAYSQFNVYEYGNAFEAYIPKKSKLINDFIFRTYKHKYGIVLNTQEMASLWHLPLPSTDTPNIRWMGARVAPAPAGIPDKGFLIGYNEYRGHRTDIFMEPHDRQRHTYVIGKTGSGKSWFLRYLAIQDIRAGHGVCVVDPHGDLVDMILGTIPKDRIDDVIYFNPSDTERPMGLNMLEARDESMKDFVVQEMISIFYMLFPPEMIGPMFEHNMRNFMLTLMADPENPGTIAEIPRMIADDTFQKRWIARVKDPVVRSFWEDEMAKTSDYHKSEMMGYLVSKVGRFVENEMMRNIIGQAKSSFDFRKVMDEGKILLINLSKGKTGDVNANLLGMIIVSKLQQAAFARADMPEEERKDFYLYLDEFQNFITPSISTILSEARKYKLNLVMAHQYMGQLVKDGKSEIRDAVLGNVGSILASRIGPEDTEILAKVFEPELSGYDLMNNAAFSWNAKLMLGGVQRKPLTLKAMKADKDNPRLADALKEVSRLTYGRPKDLVEREIAIRAGIGIGAGQERKMPPVTPTT